MDKAELIRHEIEKRRDHNLAIGNPLFAAMAEEDIELLSFIDSLQEEPVSEDLEEAAKNHAVERYRVTRNMVLAEKCKWSFQTGAKWKEKQMMSKAVDAHINYAWSGLSFGGFDWSKTGLDIGDKCKLIIIKED